MEHSWPQRADSIVIKSILNAPDRVSTIAWADFGTCNERIISVTYSSPIYAPRTAIKTFNWILVGTSYRLDTIVWSVI